MNVIPLGKKLTIAIDVDGTVADYSKVDFGKVAKNPYELTEEYKGLYPGRKSKAWDTEQEVIDALLAIGIIHFQLADCSWYGD